MPQSDQTKTAEDDISQDSSPRSQQDLEHDHEPTLSAQEVFDAFITGFDLPAPELTQKPLEYFAKTLRDSLPKDDKDHVKGEPYFFGSVIERIEKATANESDIQTKIEKVRDAVRRSQYTQAALAAISVPAANLTKTDLTDLLSVLKATAPNIADYTSEQKLLYSSVGNMVEALLQQNPPDDLTVRRQIAWALACKAHYSMSLKSWDALNIACGQIVEMFTAEADPEIQERVAWALVRKGGNLGQTGHSEEALALYGDVVKRFENTQYLPLQKQISTSLISKAQQLNVLKRYPEVIVACDTLVNQFGGATDASIKQQVSQASTLKLAGVDHHLSKHLSHHHRKQRHIK